MRLVQEDRQRWIDWRFFTVGYVGRRHIIARFDVSDPLASNDLGLYVRSRLNMTRYDFNKKVFTALENFRPTYEYPFFDEVKAEKTRIESVYLDVSAEIEPVGPNLALIFKKDRRGRGGVLIWG